MNKISEQKALEVYPIKIRHSMDSNRNCRNGYVKGYNQALQNFLKKAEKFISEKVQDYFLVDEEEYIVDFDKEECIKDFKNYMQDESEN